MWASQEDARTATTQVQQDSLFWMREVYERVWTPFKPKKGGASSAKRGREMEVNTLLDPSSNSGNNSPRARARGDQTGRHPGHNSPQGLPYCRDFHQKKSCAGNGAPFQNCSVMKDGWIWNAAPSLFLRSSSALPPSSLSRQPSE